MCYYIKYTHCPWILSNQNMIFSIQIKTCFIIIFINVVKKDFDINSLYENKHEILKSVLTFY